MTCRNWLAAVVLILSSCAVVNGQAVDAIPGSLKPSLKKRLLLFTQAQAHGRWDVVASMLGRYRRGGTGDHPYSKKSKDCLIAQMEELPMTSFAFKTVSVSTEILSMPAARRWWYLIGDATIRTKTGEYKRQSSVVAYRDNGEWYFTPPNYDDYWESTHLSDSELSADHADEIHIQNTPECPLQISDLHAFIKKPYLSLLNLTFRLNNRTAKKVKTFSLLLYGSNGGNTSYGAGDAIEPLSFREVTKLDSSRSGYFCDGVNSHNLIVEYVTFSDGSEWHQPRKNLERAKREFHDEKNGGH